MGDVVGINPGINVQDWQRSGEERAIGDLKNHVPNDPKRIADSARSFESLLIGKWLEAAETSLATVPGGTEDEQNDETVKQYSSLAVQALAGNISASGGIGIARMIEKALSHQAGIDSKGLTGTTDGLSAINKEALETKVLDRNDR
jgi:Rod binding domain-containing protein